MRIIFLLLLLSQQLFAQVRLTGTIMSATLEPLEGSVITVKGTSQKTISDKMGKFSIEAPANSILTVSHVGYTAKEINTGTSTVLEIVLEKSTVTLQEVVLSTGYEEIQKARSTGSFNKIDNELFNYKTGSDVLSRLDGMTPSVLFDKRKGAQADIRIRGLSTLNYASPAPLIVLDNFPYEGDINNINPNDVESITILKDAAASSIWGIRAANGVIVITSKKGQFNQPLRLSVSSNVTFIPKPDLLSIPKMASSDFIDVEKFLFDKGFYNSDISNTSTRPPLTPVVEILAKQRAGLLLSKDANLQIDSLRNVDVRNDFLKYLYRDAIIQQYGLNMNGGSRTNKYYFSAGYDQNLANLIGNSNDRLTFRLENTYQPFKKLQLTIGGTFTKSKAVNNSPGGYGDIGTTGKDLYPYAQLADAEGKALPINNIYRGTYTDTAGQGKLLDWKYRPLDELNNVRKESSSSAILGNIGLRYDVSRSLNAEIKYQFQENRANTDNNYTVNSFTARNLINKFTQINGNTVKYILPYGGILDASNSKLQSYGIRGQVNFNKAWAKNIITAIAGAEARETEVTSSSHRVYGYDDKLNFTNVDHVNGYPTYGNIGGTLRIETGLSFKDIIDRAVSMYANASWTYNKLYTFSASVRKDASNLFGVKANRRGIPLWSAGAAWNISGEKFYHMQALPQLIMRASFGYGGNVSSLVSALTTISYSPASDQPITNIPFALIQNDPNPNLKWERAGILNTGIDFSTKNERLSGSIEYFRKHVNNLLGRQSLDPTTGISTLVTNSAVMNGQGFDIALHGKVIDGTGLNWNASLFFSHAKNKIVRYLLNTSNNGFVSNGTNITPIEGMDPYAIVSYRWGGLDAAGNPVGFIKGVASTDYTVINASPLQDQVVSGPALPRYFGGFRNTLLWKGLSVSANVTWRLGYYFRRELLSYSALFTNGRGNPEFSDRWQNRGDENITNVPAMIYPRNATREIFYAFSENGVEKGDHIRLEDIRIGYDLKKASAKIRSISFYAVISNINVLLWRANKRSIDPEYINGLVPPAKLSIGFKFDL